ncbi:MAG: sulfatase-like hydrolase/transferase [Lentisphaerae bacterium]|jgi:arylsulfatase|nr:sulfatase-like hydrolase/transferase [Lentisphaerota bacterium]MBT5612915.1 sulfatase-like hydrolase/transferase [Lentisphaerota bacterium]MBT7061867.1 sulfatase-like hydrolase/transferase [Lentisphaerota bacterium]MBT7846959.1 sulfatase-like hydrolase/transferase [Lentisphaerota bacterium]
MPEKPLNVLWICTDQQRFDTLGCTGNAYVHTPNLDRLAREGVLFEQAYCQNPVCAPSRASFLTGRYPRTTRCRQNGQPIPESERLVPKLLHDQGYVCGLSGKLHLSPCRPEACPGTERRIDDGYDVFHWSHHPNADWPSNEYGLWLAEKGERYGGERTAQSRFVSIGMPEPLHQTTWCVEKALHFMQASARKKRPWLFSINIFDPHHSFDPPAEYLKRYASVIDEIPLPNYVAGELDDKPSWQRTDHAGAYGGKGGHAYDKMSETDHRWIRAAYWAMVDLIDHQVGRLLDWLDESGERENTLVIFCSDHGEMLGDHGIYLKGPYFYDCGVHVPLIMSCPGLFGGGRRSSGLVELVDLAPTILELAGMVPQEGMQGRSLVPLLRGTAPLDTFREDVYCEFYGSNFYYEPSAQTTMLRTERHKLTVAHGLGTGELYDLVVDPAETSNQWDNPDCLQAKADLLARLADRMAWTADPLPTRESVW